MLREFARSEPSLAWKPLTTVSPVLSGSPKLETIRMLVRQKKGVGPELRPAEVAREDLASITVATPELAPYDELVEVAR